MKKIMVVDDNPIVREPIAKALESYGYKSISIAGGEEALAAIKCQRPDLILLDIIMPFFDGLAVLRALKSDSRYASIPVIMLTLAAEKESILEATKLGVRDYVLKTQFNLTELIKRIDARLLRGESPKNPDPTPPVPTNAPQHVASAAVVPTPISQPAVVGNDSYEKSVQRFKEIAPITTRAQMLERLAKCGELKALSPTVSRLMEMVNSAACPIEKIAKTIQQDQAVAIKILKIANSVVFSRGDPVDSVHKAVLRIGTNQIRQVVINLGVIDRFGSTGGSPHFKATQFWEHSIGCGLIAAEIMRSRGGKGMGVDAVFTMGLLHDIGRMVYAEVLGDQYNEMLALADELRLPLEQVESRLLMLNHAEAMESVLQTWRFPEDMIKPIAMHHLSVATLRRQAGDSFAEACTLALANRLAHAMLLGSSGNDMIYPTDEFVHALRLEPDVITRIERDIPTQTDEIKFAMLSRSDQEPWPSCRNEVRDKLSLAMRPICISTGTEIDAFRIVCNQLRHDASDAPPNLGVVYIREPQETAVLLGELQKAEASAGVDDLPLIVLSPTGKLSFDNSLVSKRQVRLLPTTFMMSTFSETVGKLLGPVV